MPALTTGKTAPDFSLPMVHGGDFSLAESLGRGPVVVAFFKVNCPVCQLAFPFLERLYQGYKRKSVTFIGVSQNGVADTKAFLKRFGVTFPITLDDPSGYAVSNAYGLTNVPTVFYISHGGEIDVSSVGWARADVDDITQRLASELKTKPPVVFRPGEDIPALRAG
jgi:peroxiredoxin